MNAVDCSATMFTPEDDADAKMLVIAPSATPCTRQVSANFLGNLSGVSSPWP